MRKLLILLSLIVLTTTVDAANRYRCSRNQAPKVCSLGVGGGIIYWQPCGFRNQYGFRSSVTGVTTFNNELYLNPDYAPGFQVLVGSEGCQCLFTSLIWTHFCLGTVHKMSSGNLFMFLGDTVLQVAQALARQNTHYDKVDLRVGMYACKTCNARLYGFGSLRYLYLEQDRLKRGILIDGSRQQDNEVSRFTGAGLGLGFGGQYDLSCGLGVYGDADVVASLGTRITEFQHREFNSSNVLTFRRKQQEPNRMACFPGFEAKVAATYTYDVCYFKLYGQIGWEYNYYFQPFLVRQIDLGDGNNLTTPQSIAFHGPFASLSLRY